MAYVEFIGKFFLNIMKNFENYTFTVQKNGKKIFQNFLKILKSVA